MKLQFNVLLSSLCFLFSAMQLNAQNALLWKITSDQKPGDVSYLFGTIHLQDSSLNCFSNEVWDAIEQSDIVAGELNLRDPATMLGMMTKSMMKDTVLADLMSDKELEKLTELMLKTVDPFSWAMFQKMKPIVLVGPLLMALDSMPQFDAPMDLRIQNAAKETTGLETIDEQMDVLNLMSAQEQADMLIETIQNLDSISDLFQEMKEIYRSQNIAYMQEFMSEKMTMDPHVKDGLLDKRNVVMVERLTELLKTKTVFAAVGAGHLGGDNGMIKLLRDKGYSLSPVPFQFLDEGCK